MKNREIQSVKKQQLLQTGAQTENRVKSFPTTTQGPDTCLSLTQVSLTPQVDSVEVTTAHLSGTKQFDQISHFFIEKQTSLSLLLPGTSIFLLSQLALMNVE